MVGESLAMLTAAPAARACKQRAVNSWVKPPAIPAHSVEVVVINAAPRKTGRRPTPVERGIAKRYPKPVNNVIAEDSVWMPKGPMSYLESAYTIRTTN